MTPDVAWNVAVGRQQDLYNDVVERALVVSLRDAAAENAPIGTAEVSLVPLLHDSKEVGGGGKVVKRIDLNRSF